MVGGMTLSRSAKHPATICIAPLAANAWPHIDFIDETA
jgi:hypothetical protein